MRNLIIKSNIVHTVLEFKCHTVVTPWKVIFTVKSAVIMFYRQVIRKSFTEENRLVSTVINSRVKKSEFTRVKGATMLSKVNLNLKLQNKETPREHV